MATEDDLNSDLLVGNGENGRAGRTDRIASPTRERQGASRRLP